MNRPELLAPAGTFEAAEAAFLHGADAVYIGIEKLNLRAHSPNFAVEDLPELLDMAHKCNKKVYTALNLMPDQATIPVVRELLVKLGDIGCIPDAFIISDPGVLVLCKEILPSAELHLSTQTGTFNLLSLDFWKKQGVIRAVLPREFTLSQIREASRANIMETEIFVHGAMCVSISGRCLLGAYLGERHPNRGDCPQPCRYKYRLSPVQSENVNPGIWFDAEESDDGVYLMNSKDLCTLDILPQIISSGVNSLKIEGRNKSVHYVASVVRVYRAAIDSCLNGCDNYTVLPEWRKELDALDHRTYTTGFYNGELLIQDVFSSKASAKSRVIGTIKAILPGGLPVIDVKNSFCMGEVLEIIPVQQSLDPYTIQFTKITDLSGNQIERAPSSRLVIGITEKSLRIGDMIRRSVDI
jgi:U32 family peptidase